MFCARLVGFCPAQPSVFQFCFCSGLDELLSTFNLLPSTSQLFWTAVVGLDIKNVQLIAKSWNVVGNLSPLHSKKCNINFKN